MIALDGMVLIVVSESATWHFQAGDNTAFGWLVTGVYAVLCILCWWEAWRAKTKEGESRSLPNSYHRLILAGFAVLGALVVMIPGWTLWNTWQHEPAPERLLIFGFYGAMAAVLYIVLRREVFRPRNRGKERKALRRTAWIWIALAITALGINKQLDMQTLMLQLGRQFAKIEGLMKYRRLIQAGFVVAGTITASVVGLRLWRLSKEGSSSERLVIFGFIGLIGFVMFRVARLNHVDFLGQYVMTQLPVHDFELIVSFLLCLAVWRNRH